MKKIFSTLILALLVLSAAAKIDRPKLVVGLVIDQMRWENLYYYYDDYRADGLRQLIDGGYSFENTLINYVPTVTAVGHASIYTGTVPALHGIAGNNFFIDGKKTYCCTDNSVKSLGSNSPEGQMSPRNLLASGLGDQLKLATDFKGKVIGVALKDRAAILPAGHGADAAYWWDGSAGCFVSSTYYMDRLPEWVEQTNKKLRVKPGTEMKASVMGITKTFEMAEAALINEKLGQDDITDLLAVSVSSTDALGHVYGTRGEEMRTAYKEVDLQIANFIKTLDQRVGKGNYLIFLTADHGSAHNPNMLKNHRIPAGGLESNTWLKAAGNAAAQRLGIGGKLIIGESEGRIYLDHELIKNSGKSLDEVKQAVIEEVEKQENVLFAVDFEKIATSSIHKTLREMFINGYNKKRSGDILMVAKANWEDVPNSPNFAGTTHAQWNPYDAHIPFLLYGWNVSHGQTSEPTNIVDIVPTVCAMLHIQMPNSCVGNAKFLK